MDSMESLADTSHGDAPSDRRSPDDRHSAAPAQAPSAPESVPHVGTSQTRQSFVLPKLTVTALRAPKQRKLPPAIVSTAEVPGKSRDIVAPFRGTSRTPSSSHHTRRQRAVVFADVAAAVHDGDGNNATHIPSQAVPLTVGPVETSSLPPALETPSVVVEVLKTAPHTSQEVSEVEDVLAVLHWLAQQREEGGYERGLERLRLLSEHTMSLPIPVTPSGPFPPAMTSVNHSGANRSAVRAKARQSESPPQATGAERLGGACVVLHEVIVIRLPRTVQELPDSEKDQRRAAACSGSAVRYDHLTACTTGESTGCGLHAVVLVERGLGIIAAHIVELPLEAISASKNSCQRAQEKLVELIRVKCPEAFPVRNVGDGDVSPAATLRTLSRPCDSARPPLGDTESVQPFAALSPAFPDGQRVLTYQELRDRLAASAVCATVHSPGATTAPAVTVRSGGRHSSRGAKGLNPLRPPPSTRTSTRATGQALDAVEGARRASQQHQRANGTNASRLAGFDPANPSRTSPFTRHAAMPLTYDTSGELVLRPY